MNKILEFFKNTGDSYVKSFFEFCGEKLKDWVVELLNDFDYKDIKKKAEEVKEKIISIVNQRIKLKPEYKNDSVFQQFNKNIVKSMINGILEDEKIFENIDNKVKKELNNFHLNNNSNIVNILLMGEDKKDIKLFFEIISKCFDFYKENEYENIVNIEFNKYFSSIKKINIIECNNDKMNNKNCINCIWYVIDEDFNEINTKELKTNNTSGSIPIIYIGFKNKIDPEKRKLFNKSSISNDNINIFNFSILSSYIIDDNQFNEEINKNKINSKEYFMNLIEKTILNLLVKDKQSQIENKAKKVLETIMPRINFKFGNKIKNLAVLNDQIIKIVFKKFLFENNLPNSVQIKYKKMLKDYQKHMENREKSYFSEFLSKYSKVGKKNANKDKDEILKNKILEKMIIYIDKMTNEDDEQNKNNEEIKGKKNKSMKKNEAREDDINKKMQLMFEDYFLKNSSIFINELIVNTIKEMIINHYNSGIIQYYIDIYKKEYIIISNEKKE